MAENQQVQEQESQDKDIEFEIEDDTPPEDRGREPLPKEVVKEIEEDELDEYSEKVKSKLLQMKKVYHDERREKERVLREQQEALSITQKLFEENKKLKSRLTEGEKSLVMTATSAAELELEMAKQAYKEAYDSGDSERIVNAQEKLNTAGYRLQRLKGYVPPVQTQETEVNLPPQQAPQPRLDQKTNEWRSRNTWFGTDAEMTALALGLDQKLIAQHGPEFVGTDEYWKRVDKTMRARFPEYGWEIVDSEDEETVEVDPRVTKQRTESAVKPATVVAPATRSTSSKRVKLKQSQLDLVKKLGITPEQYAREILKLGV
jgi:hypothetical protein